MVVLEAAVVLVGALCALDLLLTVGVIRRLRQHTEMLGAAGPAAPPVTGLAPGEQAGAFTAVTLDGELVASSSGLRAVGFFAARCSACPEQVGPFTDYLAGHAVGADSALSVVVAAPGEPPAYLDRLRAAGRVCVAEEASDLLAAFKVSGFPAFFALDPEGVVLGAGYDPARLPAPAAV